MALDQPGADEPSTGVVGFAFRGKIAAEGPVEQLVAQAEGLVQISVEVQGAGAEEALRSLPGAKRVEPRESREGRSRLALSSTSVPKTTRPHANSRAP